MRILLTGATGYIGQLLLPRLLAEGHTVVCCVRDPGRFQIPKGAEDKIEVFKVDFLNMEEGKGLHGSIDVAYYLIHSMSASRTSFDEMEKSAATNFLQLVEGTGLSQIIYLSGISNEETLSKHLKSRFAVEEALRSGPTPVTILRAGIIVGAGSASFELIRDLVEKLPVMITPKWLKTRCQPISAANVLAFLTGIKLQEKYYNKSFDIGGPDILSYKRMLLSYAKVRGLRRSIFTVPVMTPRLSSYWLYFMTSVSYSLAVNLVDSMKVEVICKPNQLAEELGIQLHTYTESVEMALRLYGMGKVFSSWKDALSSSFQGSDLSSYNAVPQHGCLTDRREKDITGRRMQVLENIWAIGGRRGWYYGSWLWRMRGAIDKLFGGVGLRRGRTHATKLEAGDVLDFWRVLDANKAEGRLLLFAEMKLPGEAWLEFRIEPKGDGHRLIQTAIFRPKGLWGRAYWYMVVPMHFFVFRGMIRKIVAFEPPKAVALINSQ